jgi:diguanylate cyclase (GGDEF)-like protein/PAS domain S-box-containing protein
MFGVRRVKLKVKIWLLLGALLSVVLVIDLGISYRKLEAETRAETEYDARTIYAFMMATRRIYQQQFIASGLPVNEKTIGFLPAHSFSRISRDFANWNQNGILFNNVSDRPRNPRNQADRFELEAIRWFRHNPKQQERMQDIVSDQGVGYMLYTAPIWIEPFCLKCHGERTAAPASISQRYQSAYGYQVGDLRGVVSIRIPTAKFQERLLRIWGGELLKSLIGYATLLFALGFILDRLVTRRLSRLEQGAQRIAAGDYGARIPPLRGQYGQDEIVGLAETFNRMAAEVQHRDQSLGQLTLAVEQSPESIVITDLKGNIEYVNAAFVRNTGYTDAEAIGANPRILQSGKTPPETYCDLWSTLNRGEVWQGEFVNRRKDASEYIESAIIAPVRNDGVITHYLAIKQDITDRKKAEAEIHNLAYFDPLTNLPNRRLLLDRLGQALIAGNRSGTYGALLILDLDNFKALNDTQGHDVGDQLLIEVALRLTANVRQEDTVSRLGGDEYVLMLEGLGMDERSAAHQAEMIAEKVRLALAQPYTLAGVEQMHRGTVSIGMTLFHGLDESTDMLMKQADVALYQAKDAGRNKLRFFNPAMQAAIDSRIDMENALRRALSDNELELHYQPQIGADGALIGAEALLRWRRPGESANSGLMSPANFIPLAEETGLIVPIGEWVLQTACNQLMAWAMQAESRDLQLAINVSARQFLQADFVDRIAACLRRSGVTPARLKLELTESVVLDNVEEVICRMQQIKALGVAFSLDDFGTGYSSLSYLKRLPLDQIKIDQSFVRDISSDPNDAAIVRAILAMSQSLGLDVIAEGVETQAQRDFLQANGCPAFQGYLYGKPMPIDEWQIRFGQG